MRDIVLVTVECLRRDRADLLAPELGDPVDCHTAGHYTRPALAGLLSGDVTAAIEGQCRTPTIAGVLRDAGYSTLGVSHSPQTTRGLGFHDGLDRFAHDPGEGEGRGSRWREWLAQFRPVRTLHRRLRPKAATLAQLPDDDDAIDQALRWYAEAPPPRFLWVHLMDSHRPYGRGDRALPRAVSRAAAGAAPGRLAPSVGESAAETICDHYDRAVRRTGGRVRRLVSSVGDDAAVVVCGDHGEELGEAGYWFHGPYRRRVVDALTTVPLWTRHVPVDDGVVRQTDIPAALARVAGVSGAPEWGGGLGDADHALTAAPWAGTVTLRYYRTRERALTFEGATGTEVDELAARAPDEQLRALGYI